MLDKQIEELITHGHVMRIKTKLDFLKFFGLNKLLGNEYALEVSKIAQADWANNKFDDLTLKYDPVFDLVLILTHDEFEEVTDKIAVFSKTVYKSILGDS